MQEQNVEMTLVGCLMSLSQELRSREVLVEVETPKGLRLIRLPRLPRLPKILSPPVAFALTPVVVVVDTGLAVVHGTG